MFLLKKVKTAFPPQTPASCLSINFWNYQTRAAPEEMPCGACYIGLLPGKVDVPAKIGDNSLNVNKFYRKKISRSSDF